MTIMKMKVFGDATPCRIVKSYRRFGQAWSVSMFISPWKLGPLEPEDGGSTLLWSDTE